MLKEGDEKGLARLNRPTLDNLANHLPQPLDLMYLSFPLHHFSAFDHLYLPRCEPATKLVERETRLKIFLRHPAKLSLPLFHGVSFDFIRGRSVFFRPGSISSSV